MTYPVYRFHPGGQPAQIANSAEEDGALAEQGFIPADEFDLLPPPPPFGTPTPQPEASPLDAIAASAAAEYWLSGQGAKFELYVIGVHLGAPVDLTMTAADMKAALEPFRPV